MKAISLWQPWASWVVAGIKKVETRNWATNYRGPLLIHAAKKYDERAFRWMACDPSFLAAMTTLGDPRALTVDKSLEIYRSLPFGALIGQVYLVNCQSTDTIGRNFPIHQAEHGEDIHQWWEVDLGDFSKGRYGWFLEEPVKFREPLEYKGKQGFFEVSPQELPDWE